MAKKKESTLINMLVALFVITAVSGGVLGLVYGLTAEKIAQSEKERNDRAIQAVLPLENVNYDDTITLFHEKIAYPCNIARDNQTGAFKGIAIKTSEGGFGGKIELMVGILANGTIKGVSVLSHSETPGLGANMTGTFKDQFVDRTPGNDIILEVTKNHDGQKVDAITAATITSKAFTKAVDKAYQAYEANKDQLNATPNKENDSESTVDNPDEENNNGEENNNEEGGIEQ